MTKQEKGGEKALTLKGTLQRKSVACLLTALVVLLTVLVSGGRGLAKLRSKADEAFTQGVLSDGLSIAHDLEQRLENAGNIGIVARRYRPADEALAQMTAACEVLRRALGQEQERGEMAAANRELSEAVETLYRSMESWGLDDTDQGLVAKQYRSFLSAGDTISHDGYNQMAAKFNKTLSGVPAGLIGALTGVQPLELFQ